MWLSSGVVVLVESVVQLVWQWPRLKFGMSMVVRTLLARILMIIVVLVWYLCLVLVVPAACRILTRDKSVPRSLPRRVSLMASISAVLGVVLCRGMAWCIVLLKLAPMSICLLRLWSRLLQVVLNLSRLTIVLTVRLCCWVAGYRLVATGLAKFSVRGSSALPG